MRFFHLADLHIGKVLNHVSFLEDQRLVLQQVLDAIDVEQPDAVVLAGDIYDRRNPSIQAIEVMDDFLSTVVLQKKVPVIAIGGNHDSGERLEFANGILARAGLHLEGVLQLPLRQVRLKDAWGEVIFHLLPYADVSFLHHLQPEWQGLSYEETMHALMDDIVLETGTRHVLVTHGMVIGSDAPEESDSERTLSVGGTASWYSDRFSAFQYVALGHLHRAQRAGADHVRYSGSLMKYSFSEESHQKGFYCVDLDASGTTSYRFIPLTMPRDMVTLRGTLQVLLEGGGAYDAHRTDYVRVILEDAGEVLEPMARLRAVYPHIMLLQREWQQPLEDAMTPLPGQDQSESPMALVQIFYEELCGEPMQDTQMQVMQEVFDEVKEQLS